VDLNSILEATTNNSSSSREEEEASEELVVDFKMKKTTLTT
jgi:hypothetical protein